jgi:4-amino-4-deoxy-L-arabinose transferase-like glycosyltransferase
MTRRTATLVACALLAAHAALAIHSLWSKSATFDETSHLPAGLAMLATGEARLNPQHPPLAKLLAALAASPLSPRIPLSLPAYEEGKEWEFGRTLLFRSGNDPIALLRAARLPTVALSLLGGLAVFAWSRARAGPAAGCLSLALYAFSPTAIAHAQWVTMDAAVSAFATAALGLWWAIQRRAGGVARELACGAALGLALATKFSALFLLPALAAAQLAAGDLRPPWRRLRPWLVALPAAALVVELAYLWPDDPLRWLRDLAFLHADHPADYVYYLAGEFRQGRFPSYFLVAMGVKSSLPELAAMAAGLALALLRRDHWRDDVYLWVPAGVWLAAHSAFADDLGVRYVLPVYPLLFVLAGSLVPAARSLGREGAAALLLLAAAQAATAVRAHPDHLAYFNPLAGGTRGGPAWLDDSNLDWGQELQRLPAWLRERGIDRVRLLPFGTADPLAYAVPVEPMLASDWQQAPRPGAYVISAHWLVHGLYMADTRGLHTDWLRRYEPQDVLGGSLYLYVFSGADAPAAGRAEPSP